MHEFIYFFFRNSLPSFLKWKCKAPYALLFSYALRDQDPPDHEKGPPQALTVVKIFSESVRHSVQYHHTHTHTYAHSGVDPEDRNTPTSF